MEKADKTPALEFQRKTIKKKKEKDPRALATVSPEIINSWFGHTVAIRAAP